jgi:hypothetical protein
MPTTPTLARRKILKRTPGAAHRAFLKKVPIMGESTLTTIEIIAVEECSQPSQPGRLHPCVTLKSSDFSFAKRKPSRTAPSTDQKIRVFSPRTPRASAVAAIVASRHIHGISPDRALIYIEELGVETESAMATAADKKALVTGALEKLYANWKNVERVIIVTDSRIFPEVVSRTYKRMFPEKSVPQVVPTKLAVKSIRVSIDVKTAKMKISRR